MIRLEPLESRDFSRLISWIDSPRALLIWAGPVFTWPLDEPQLARHLARSRETDPPSLLVYRVVEIESAVVLGHIELMDIDRQHRSARIGKVLVGDVAQRGLGLGRQMIREVLRVGFADLRLHRISLGVFDFNTPAIRCYESEGFVREGLLREVRRLGDEYWNLYEMSILEHEWRARS